MTTIDAVRRDFAYSFRTLRRAPGFTLTVVLVLALGIGATTALFSVVDGVLLRPLPVRYESRILVIEKVLRADHNPLPFQQADILALGESTRMLEDVGGVQYDGAWPYLFRDGDRMLTINAAGISGEFFRVLGVTPALGRLVEPADARPGAEPVTVISHDLWQRQYGGDVAVIGRVLRLRGTSVTVIGVAPPGLDYPRGTEAWIPLRLDPVQVVARDMAVFTMIGKLAAGASLEQARLEAAGFLREREASYRPGEPKGHEILMRPFRDAIVGDVRPTLLILFAAVLLVQLIVNVNISSLLLVRVLDRRRELAVRTALGASRGRIVQHLLSEAMILATAGAVIGILLAFWGLEVLLVMAPPELPRTSEIGLDARVLRFVASLALLTMILFTLGPALWASTPGAHATLRGGARAGPESRPARMGKHALVAIQVATAVVVIVGASLLVRSLLQLERVDMGFAADDLTFAPLSLQGEQYQDDARRLAFFEGVSSRLEAIPGIDGATAILLTPFSGTGGWTADYTAEGQSESEAASNPGLNYEPVLPNYFRTIGLPISRGRGFSDADRGEAPPVAIVSARFAAHAWPGQDPIGKRLKFGSPTSQEPWMTVIGVVAETRFRDLVAPMPTLYVPAYQHGPAPSVLVARSAASTRAVAALIRQAVAEVDPNERAHTVQNMSVLMAEPLARPRFTTLLVTGLAVVALLLAASGLYGLLTAVVAKRENEIGVRRALGAQAPHIRRIVLGRVLILTSSGAVAGLALGLIAARALQGILFDTGPTDAVAISSAVTLLTVTGAVACYFPVRRALRVDPASALRAE